jgi:hypothetical protein
MTFATLPYRENHPFRESPWSERLCVKPETTLDRVLLCFARGFWYEHPIAGRIFVLETRGALVPANRERRAGSCGTCNRESAPGTCPECWPPPVEQTDPAARRVAWVLWTFALAVGLGLVAWKVWS